MLSCPRQQKVFIQELLFITIMKKIFLLIILIVLVSVVGAIFLFNNDSLDLNLNKCKIEETREIPVSLELAKSAGENSVHKYYPEFDWIYIGNYIAYSSTGGINYYILIFRKSEFTTLNTLEKLEQNAKLYSDTSSDESDQKYQFNDIATIMTASMKEVNAIQRHYRGIPGVIGKKLKIKEFIENKYSEKTIGNLILDSPMGTFYYEIVDKNSKKSSSNLISAQDFSIVPVADLIKSRKNIQERKEKGYSAYDKEKCEWYQGAILEAEKAHIVEWNEFE